MDLEGVRFQRKSAGSEGESSIQRESSFMWERKSSKTVRKVSWVEEARHEAQKQVAFRSNMFSKKGPWHTTRFVSVTEGATN
jgi:hypothetical protein